jgi:formimidoylglutamate deiminase
MTESSLFAERALLADGWARDVRFEIAPDGALTAVVPGAQAGAAPRAGGVVLPGMPNLHSHAFQRAMAGLAERAGPGEDSFWTWREVMYGFVERLNPEQVEAIAAQLYVEMLKAGYTAVGEFHYLHHDAAGRPYADPAEMSRRVIAAARATGIGVTQLPVLYGFSDFGGQAARPGQRRFLHEPDAFLRLVEVLMAAARGDPNLRVGIAPHSLRAVTPETLAAALAGLDALDAGAPVHIHIAEQHGEVRDCIDWCGLRPVEWLLENAAVGPRWCLVHATHVTEEEAGRLAVSGAVAGLCPTTEANLGDGVFPAPAYLEAGGAFGIGSDSHISVSPIEELRWLEYGQRLTARRRNLLARGPEAPSVGARLFEDALAGGAQALGRPIGRLAPGARADLMVVDPERPSLYGRTGGLFLDALVFAGRLGGARWPAPAGRRNPGGLQGRARGTRGVNAAGYRKEKTWGG